MPETAVHVPFTEDPALLDAPVLVTGATGYIGGRLVPALLSRGQTVRALGRSLEKLGCRPWAAHPRCELAQGDVLDEAALRQAMDGCRAAYYLVHSMQPGNGDFREKDRRAAQTFAKAAEAAGLRRIVYLGGITQEGEALSKHLASRAEVARIFMDSAVDFTGLRAAQILGSGSASFELIRYVVERLPIMVTPRWVNTEAQPIAVGDALGYLMGVLDHPEAVNREFDIGGPDIVTYRQLFDLYADVAGLRRRLIISLPYFTPQLSSYWIGLVTPIPPALGRPLILGMKNRVVCHDDAIRQLVPFEPKGVRETLEMAVNRVAEQTVETCWSDAGWTTPPEWLTCGDAGYAGGDVLGEAFAITVAAPPAEVWREVTAIGGENGWYCANFLWKLRGWMDRLIGGPGLRRGRRHPTQLQVGDALDFWRVLALEENTRLLLLAEMKAPGDALLEFTLRPAGENRTELVQTSNFLPRGLLGLAYWWATFPAHLYIFRTTLANIAKQMDAEVLSGPTWVTREQGRSACKIDL